MKPRVWISEATFSDGTALKFDKNDIVVFVGPNNVGKSAALKEMHTFLRQKQDIGKVVKTIQIEKEGSLEDCLEYISDDELVEITPENIRIRKSELSKKIF